jgi:hypothetical protein
MQPTTPQPSGTEAPEEQQQNVYRPQEPAYEPAQADPTQLAPPAVQSVSWEASEYIHRSKDVVWIIVFILVSLGFLGAALWFRAWTFAALVVVMSAAMGFFAFRQPRVLKYSLTPQGLQIGEKHYGYQEFKAFGVRAEDAFYSVVLLPVKRFMPAITIYFAETEGEKIVDILGQYLPMEKLKTDFLDTFMRRLHF